ncbi:MAG: sialidase family protein [Methanobacteriota archaeon]
MAFVGHSNFVARSPDGGLTYPDVAVVARGSGAGLGAPAQQGVVAHWHDKGWIGVAPDGTALLVWTDAHGGTPDQPAGDRCDILFAASEDGGRSWTPPATVERAPSEVCFSGAYPAVSRGGSWVVAYETARDGPTTELRISRSTDRGATWTRAQVLAPAAEFAAFPVLKVDPTPTRSRLYVAYPAPAMAPAGAEVPVLRWSDDGGVSWTEPLVLDAPEALGRTRPGIDVGPDGAVYGAFYHPMGTAEAPRADVRVVAVREGVVSAPVTVDTEVVGGTAALGDYIGIAALPGGGAFAVWVTSDGSEYDLVGARVEVAK